MIKGWHLFKRDAQDGWDDAGTWDVVSPCGQVSENFSTKAKAVKFANATALPAVECEWFAGCTREATHMESHPAFPDGVPSCDRCSEIGR